MPQRIARQRSRGRPSCAECAQAIRSNHCRYTALLTWSYSSISSSTTRCVPVKAAGNRKSWTVNTAPVMLQSAESGGGSSLGSCRFNIPIARIGRRHQGLDQLTRGGGDLLDRPIEGSLVGPRGVGESTELPDELKGRGLDLFLRRRRLEIEQRFDVSAHRCSAPARRR